VVLVQGVLRRLRLQWSGNAEYHRGKDSGK